MVLPGRREELSLAHSLTLSLDLLVHAFEGSSRVTLLLLVGRRLRRSLLAPLGERVEVAARDGDGAAGGA